MLEEEEFLEFFLVVDRPLECWTGRLILTAEPGTADLTRPDFLYLDSVELLCLEIRTIVIVSCS